MGRAGVLTATMAVLTAAAIGQGQLDETTSAPAHHTVITRGGTSATLTEKSATLTPKKGFSDVPYNEMYGSLHEANKDIGKALQKVEEAKTMIEEAKKNIPRNELPMYLRILGGDDGSMTTETAEEIDELSTKTRARLKKAKEREKEIRERIERGLF